MSIDKSNVVHIGAAKDTLSAVPTPPPYLSSEAKSFYKKMGERLVKIDRLKETYLPALEIFASAMAQFHFANKEINRKNKAKFGDGYIQTFKTGATNITTEIVLRNDAEKTLFHCFKQFGLDPLSDKGLKNQLPTGQMDLFEDFLNGTK